MATKEQATISLKTDDVSVEVAGTPEAVQRVYQALQGELNSVAPNALSNGGEVVLNVKGAKKKAEG